MNDDLILIRPATLSDAPALLGLYAPYVTETAITFEYTIPTLTEFEQRMAHVMERYPYLAAEQNGQILGYAYASSFRPRAAYDWSVETSIYLDRAQRGKGVGTRLYHTLEEQLKKQHILNVYACIAYPNPESIGFHQQLGYKTIGHFTQCGYKNGIWYDMIWMEKMLGQHGPDPIPVFYPAETGTD